eukprot:SAG22_NODE_4322_length_1305_cov_1.148425_1_plen_292_part_01
MPAHRAAAAPRPARRLANLFLGQLFARLCASDMYDVLEPQKLPPAECPHGCANWNDLASSGNHADQRAVDRLWQHGAPPAGAGDSCAQPGRAVNFTGIGTFNRLQLCPLLPAPPHKGEKEKHAPEPGFGTGNCSQAGYVGAFCLCAGAPFFNASARGAAAGWGHCRSRPHVPEQVNLQLAHSRALVVSFVTFPGASSPPASLPPPPEVQYWEERSGAEATSRGVTRHWASPAVDYALEYHKPPFNRSVLHQKPRQYFLHFVKLPRLEPLARYRYRVRCGGPWSGNFSVAAPP